MESINHREPTHVKNAFDLDFLDEIVKSSKKLFTPVNNNGGYSGAEDKNISYNRQTWPIHNLNVLESKLREQIEDINNTNYQFDLHYVENIMYAEYKSKNKSKLDWHIDIGPHPYNERKLSFIIFTNDPSEYEGGQLQIWTDNNQYTNIPKSIGGIVVFPSFLPHRVTSVTKGIRKVIIGFVNGNPYK